MNHHHLKPQYQSIYHVSVKSEVWPSPRRRLKTFKTSPEWYTSYWLKGSYQVEGCTSCKNMFPVKKVWDPIRICWGLKSSFFFTKQIPAPSFSKTCHMQAPSFWLTRGPHPPSGKTSLAIKHVLRSDVDTNCIQRIVLGPPVYLHFTRCCWNDYSHQILPGPQVRNQNYKDPHPWTRDRCQTWASEDSAAASHPKISHTIPSPWVEALKQSKERLIAEELYSLTYHTLRWEDVKSEKQKVIWHIYRVNPYKPYEVQRTCTSLKM